jgi:GTP pyrophosphokinase
VHLRTAPPAVRLVAAADKLHNARSILADYRTHGESLWTRFHGGRDGTLWYYATALEVLRDGGPAPIADELGRTLAELMRLAGPSRVA